MTTNIRIVIRSFDHQNHESCILCYDRLTKEVYLVKTPCDSGDIRLLGQAKKISERMLLPHHAWPLRTRGYAAWERIKEVSDTTGNIKEWRQSY